MVSAKNRSKWALSIVAIVFVLATILQLFTPTPVYADTESDIHDMNYKYYAARYLRDCLFNLDSRFKNSIAQNALNEGTWLYSGYKVNIGRYFERDDGVAGCDETSIVKTAMTSLGYGSDPGKLLTDIGYTKQGDSYIRPASGDTMNTTVVDKYQQRDYAKYAALQYIFNNDTSDRGKCELIEPPTGKSPAQITYKKVVKNDNGDWVVQDTKAEFQTEYAAKSNKVNYDYKAGARNSATCIDLRAEMDGLVNAVVTYNKQHQDDPITDGLLNGGQAECNKDSPSWNPDTESCADEDTPICSSSIGALGWLICPAMTLMANLADTAYGFLASHFLQVDTDLVSSKTRDAWAKFRDVANVAFVIALLVVIYSQLTSVGITNYGIKKMLPKIIVAALLVNLSFLICQIAVDLSNIAGYGVNQFFTGLGLGTKIDSGTTYDVLENKAGEAVGWTLVVGSILVAGTVGIALGVSVPVLLSALLAIGLIVLILVARQALIVLLVVISPLAFVAYLLPNTEQWFKKWTKMFATLLLLFPIIGVVFGASKLAGGVLFEAAGEDLLMQAVALGVTAIPFFVVPGLLKGALSAAGTVGAKMKGWADGAGKRVGSGVNKNAQKRYENSAFARGRSLRKQAKDDYKTRQYAKAVAGEDGSVMGRLRRRAAMGVTGRSWTNAGDHAMRQAEMSAQSKVDAMEAEEFKYATERQKDHTTGEIVNMAISGEKDGVKLTAPERAAAVERAMTEGGFSQRKDLMSALASSKGQGTNTRALRQRAVAKAYAKGDQEAFGTGFGDQVIDEAGSINSENDLKAATVANAAAGNVTADQLGQNASRTGWIIDSIHGSSGSTNAATAEANVRSAARDALVANTTKGNLSPEIKGHLGRI